MQRPVAATIGLLLLGFGGGCVPSSLSTLLPSLPALETSSLAAPPGPYETAIIASGTPTEVYALVARGVLGCWFGADGPLKASHVFQAEAEPPAKGGAAEIVIHEVDANLRDRRGARAYRVSIASVGANVRVGMSALKFDRALAEAMAKDVATWAKGGAGCQLRALLPPPLPVAGRVGKARTASKKR